MFRKWMTGAVAFSVLGLAACGGGGGSGGGSGGGTSVPTLNVSLSASSGSAQVSEGATATALTVTATSSGQVSTPVVSDLQFDHAVFASVTAVAGATAGTYVVTAQTLPDLEGGEYKGNITFRLCEETACTHIYAGSIVSYAYDIAVQLNDWQTYQRNARHDGYVNITVDASKLSKVWAWDSPYTGNADHAINSVATGGGLTFVTTDDYFGTGNLYALKADGSVAWSYSLGQVSSEGPPAYDNGIVYVSSISANEQGSVWAIDAKTGTYKFKMSFASQWSNLSAPTIYNHILYISAGYYGGLNYAFDASTGQEIWEGYGPHGGGMGLQTPAVDANNVYYYSSLSMDMLNRGDGTLAASIDDAFAPGNADNGYFSAPVLSGTDDVLALSGDNFSGRALSSSEPYYSRILVDYSISKKTYAWRTSAAYSTQPAVAKGMIYIAGTTTGHLDAINATDGTVAWSWTPGETNPAFHRNIIVTNNLVFVSTNEKIYAVDLKTHQTVWSYAAPGVIAISPDYKLYIATGAMASDGHLTVFSLK